VAKGKARSRSTGGSRGRGGGSGPGRQIIARNPKARHDYELLATYEAGICLLGSEVKSLRAGRASLGEAYARIQDGDLWLYGMHIPPYTFARDGGHEPLRPRKLLLHRGELEELRVRTAEAGFTVVPLQLYFTHGLAKVEVALARGKKRYDRRQATARRDAQREIERAVARATRRGWRS
jgi:SsrA-binding protein